MITGLRESTAFTAAGHRLSTLRLKQLRVRDFRNLARIDLTPSPGVNVIAGDNGHGKTSLLEAIYFAATSRSFRATRASEVVRHGAEVASSAASFLEVQEGAPSANREQVVSVQRSTTSVRIDGVKPRTLAEFATRSPIVAFHVDEIALSSGPPTRRRTLLDRLALFAAPAFVDHRARYLTAVRSRQRLLQTAHHAAHHDPTHLASVEAFESLCAAHGAAITSARARAVELLATELVPAYDFIVGSELVLSVRYAPGGSADPAEAVERLAATRQRDAHRPSPGFGPHRDDLELLIDGHPARGIASQGQHRALAIALKAAEAATIATCRGVFPILLLDDISSELDPRKTEALFAFLGASRAQIFLTTTRPDLISTPPSERAARGDFRLERGALAIES